MTLDQLKAFLTELQKNKELLNAIRVAATANEIAEIASGFGYQFSGDELKAASKENIAGKKIKAAKAFLIIFICTEEKYLVCDLQIKHAKVHEKEAHTPAKIPNMKLNISPG